MGPFDKNKRFLDTGITASDFRDNRSGDHLFPDTIGNLITPNLGVGERQVPGQDDFRLADTPQAWVFLLKKQWTDDTWTYVVDDGPIEDLLLDLEVIENRILRLSASLKGTENPADQGRLEKEIAAAQAEQQRIQAEINAEKAKIGQIGGILKSTGKLDQINVRTALGNIITRKLDWMNDHEKFTKVPSATQNTFEALQIEAQRQRVIGLFGEATATANEIDRSIATLEASTATAVETLADEQAKPIDEQDQDLISDASTLISLNEERITTLRTQREALTAQLLLLESSDTETLDEVDRLTALLYRPTTLSSNAFTRYYQAPPFKTKDTETIRDIKNQINERIRELEDKANVLIRESKTPDNTVIDDATIIDLTQDQEEYLALRRDLISLEAVLQANQTTAPIEIESGSSIFNGVIELANVPSVNTTVSLEGEGSASFTIENPQNIFAIDREDIELALSEDPFLEASDASTFRVHNTEAPHPDNRGDLTFYRGRLYPSHIVSLLRHSGGAAVNAGHLSQFTAQAVRARNLSRNKTALKNQITQLNEEIEALAIQIANRAIPEQDKIILRSNLSNAQVEKEEAEKTLTQVQRNIKDARQDQERVTEQINKARRALIKYYMGKAIIEPLDRIYIWMTSPTRTLYRLNRQGEDKYAIEDPSVIRMGQQLAAAEERLTQLQSIVSTEIDRVEEFIDQAEDQSLGVLTTPAIMRFQADLNVLYTLGPPVPPSSMTLPETRQYLARLEESIPAQERKVGFIREQLKSTDATTGSQTFDRVPNNQFIQDENERKKALGDYETRHIGLEEERLQVFQGIVSSVKQTYSNGKFTLSISCKDNMAFLNMSRIMVKPALRNDREPQGVLNDPIWRNNELSGVWKNGIVVLDNVFLNDEVKARIDRNITIKRSVNPDVDANTRDPKRTGESEGRAQLQPFLTSLPFARIDAANLISFLITGIPYNFEQFIRNASFGGRLNLNQKSGTTDQREETTSLFARLKRDIGEQNDRLGDFEPYIDIQSGKFNPEFVERRKKELGNSVDKKEVSLREAYEQYLFGRLTAYFQRVSSIVNDQSRNTKGRSVVQSSTETFDPAVIRGVISSFEGWKSGLGIESSDISKQLTDLVVNAAKNLLAWQKSKFAQEENYEGEIPVNADAFTGLIQNTKKVSRADGGVFSFVYQLILAQAQSSTEIRTAQGRDQGVNTNKDPQGAQDKAVDDALSKWYRTLLRMEGTFREPYIKLAQASAELKGFTDIQERLKDFANDLQNLSPALRAVAQRGPQAAMEDIVRREKKNLVIISDRYTLDLDLQAYHTEVGGGDFNLFQSEFESPLSVCKRAADQVDFEFYADENGHLQFKPPTYNRLLKEHFPAIAEADPTVRDAVLVRFGDKDGLILQQLIRASCILNKALTEFTNKRTVVLGELEKVRNAEIKARTTTELATIAPSEFVALGVAGAISNVQDIEVEQQALVDAELKSRINKVEFQKLTELKNVPASEKAEEEALVIVRVLRGLESDTRLQIQSDLLQARTQALNQTPAERQKTLLDATVSKNTKLVALFDRIVERLRKILDDLNVKREATRGEADQFVKSLESLLDEHRIHRIFDYDLIGYNFVEAPPRFTFLEITGEPELARLPDEFYWAGGVDYDNWRHYGFMAESMQKAYFHSGSAAKTYCRAMLGRERGRIFSGDISVRGDAKYKVGDCVFIESTGMYYYITAVTHSLSYGQSYQTQLTLAYGRRLGELIPHPFDVLGNIVIETYQSDLEQLLARQTFANLQQQTQGTFAQNIGLDVAG